MRTGFLTVFTIVMLLAGQLQAQIKVSGKVLESGTLYPVSGAHVSLGKQITATDITGTFEFETFETGKLFLRVTAVGYQPTTKSVEVDTDTKVNQITIYLSEEFQRLEEVVVTATRTENRISNIPGRVELISPEKLQLTSNQSIDEVISLLPGIQVSRSFGLFSHKSTVSMRGMSSKEQARTLVLVDGVPVNKADGGSVNWNLISMLDVERVEVVKGPGSALYGGNAMGGIINIIRKKPSVNPEASLGLSYGTYNTRGIKANAGSSLKSGFYWSAGAFFRDSDGYITQSWADQKANPYIVPSTFEEKMLGLRAGYRKTERFEAGIDISVFDDRRETGEKVNQLHGNTTDHDTYSLRSVFSGKEGLWNWNASLFYLHERYKRVSEWQKDDYTWYDVLSVREDYGLLSGLSREFGRHTLSAGFDLRNGAVDASDIYYTSTDQVDNKGKIRFLGFYLQDQLNFFDGKMQLVAGLRYDYSVFYDGSFIIHQPSAETNFMNQYQFSDQSNQTWGALSPRISIQFKPDDSFRLYGGYSRGFRPSVLDDLCRSGRVRGGFKVARPDLKPEFIDNIEIGADYKPATWMKVSASAYYSMGTDFLYYVSTGDSIDMGFGNRPIMIRSNISSVEIYGIEGEVTFSPYNFLNFFGTYAYTSSRIKKYSAENAVANVDLTGKYLTDIPRHAVSFGTFYRSDWVNIGLTGRFTGKMFINDQNIFDDIVGSNQYPATMTVDLKIQREFFRHLNVALSIQNLLGTKVYESQGAVGPGRFIVVEVTGKLWQKKLNNSRKVD